jgi:PKD repeat protein
VNIFLAALLSLGPTIRWTTSCTQLVCSFDARTTTGIQGTPRYRWTWSDSAVAGDGVITTRTFPTSGTYKVRLTIVDGSGSHYLTKDLTVKAGTVTPPVIARVDTVRLPYAVHDTTYVASKPDTVYIPFTKWMHDTLTEVVTQPSTFGILVDSSAVLGHPPYEVWRYVLAGTIRKRDGKYVAYTPCPNTSASVQPQVTLTFFCPAWTFSTLDSAVTRIVP